MTCAFGFIFKKLPPNPSSFGFSSLLFCESFIVWLLKLGLPMIHFELVFMKGIEKSVSRFFFLCECSVVLSQEKDVSKRV